ncbi:MAG: hypothetical protein ACLUAR_16900 [Pilosibacter sp.]
MKRESAPDAALQLLSVDYYDIGYKAGEMGAEILMDGKDVKGNADRVCTPEVTKKPQQGKLRGHLE